MAKRSGWRGGLLAALLLALLVPASALAAGGALLKTYKRDPMPIYDDAGAKIRVIPRAQLPNPAKKPVQVVRAKDGFVGIMLDGQLTWLRKSMVDYSGDVAKIQCDAMAMKFAKLEEEGVEQSLGLGCAE